MSYLLVSYVDLTTSIVVLAVERVKHSPPMIYSSTFFGDLKIKIFNQMVKYKRNSYDGFVPRWISRHD